MFGDAGNLEKIDIWKGHLRRHNDSSSRKFQKSESRADKYSIAQQILHEQDLQSEPVARRLHRGEKLYKSLLKKEYSGKYSNVPKVVEDIEENQLLSKKEFLQQQRQEYESLSRPTTGNNSSLPCTELSCNVGSFSKSYWSKWAKETMDYFTIFKVNPSNFPEFQCLHAFLQGTNIGIVDTVFISSTGVKNEISHIYSVYNEVTNEFVVKKSRTNVEEVESLVLSLCNDFESIRGESLLSIQNSNISSENPPVFLTEKVKSDKSSGNENIPNKTAINSPGKARSTTSTRIEPRKDTVQDIWKKLDQRLASISFSWSYEDKTPGLKLPTNPGKFRLTKPATLIGLVSTMSSSSSFAIPSNEDKKRQHLNLNSNNSNNSNNSDDDNDDNEDYGDDEHDDNIDIDDVQKSTENIEKKASSGNRKNKKDVRIEKPKNDNRRCLSVEDIHYRTLHTSGDVLLSIHEIFERSIFQEGGIFLPHCIRGPFVPFEDEFYVLSYQVGQPRRWSCQRLRCSQSKYNGCAIPSFFAASPYHVQALHLQEESLPSSLVRSASIVVDNLIKYYGESTMLTSFQLHFLAAMHHQHLPAWKTACSSLALHRESSWNDDQWKQYFILLKQQEKDLQFFLLHASNFHFVHRVAALRRGAIPDMPGLKKSYFRSFHHHYHQLYPQKKQQMLKNLQLDLLDENVAQSMHSEQDKDNQDVVEPSVIDPLSHSSITHEKERIGVTSDVVAPLAPPSSNEDDWTKRVMQFKSNLDLDPMSLQDSSMVSSIHDSAQESAQSFQEYVNSYLDRDQNASDAEKHALYLSTIQVNMKKERIKERLASHGNKDDFQIPFHSESLSNSSGGVLSSSSSSSFGYVDEGEKKKTKKKDSVIISVPFRSKLDYRNPSIRADATPQVDDLSESEILTVAETVETNNLEDPFLHDEDHMKSSSKVIFSNETQDSGVPMQRINWLAELVDSSDEEDDEESDSYDDSSHELDHEDECDGSHQHSDFDAKNNSNKSNNNRNNRNNRKKKNRNVNSNISGGVDPTVTLMESIENDSDGLRNSVVIEELSKESQEILDQYHLEIEYEQNRIRRRKLEKEQREREMLLNSGGGKLHRLHRSVMDPSSLDPSIVSTAPISKLNSVSQPSNKEDDEQDAVQCTSNSCLPIEASHSLALRLTMEENENRQMHQHSLVQSYLGYAKPKSSSQSAFKSGFNYRYNQPQSEYYHQYHTAFQKSPQFDVSKPLVPLSEELLDEILQWEKLLDWEESLQALEKQNQGVDQEESLHRRKKAIHDDESDLEDANEAESKRSLNHISMENDRNEGVYMKPYYQNYYQGFYNTIFGKEMPEETIQKYQQINQLILQLHSFSKGSTIPELSKATELMADPANQQQPQWDTIRCLYNNPTILTRDSATPMPTILTTPTNALNGKISTSFSSIVAVAAPFPSTPLTSPSAISSSGKMVWNGSNNNSSNSSNSSNNSNNHSPKNAKSPAFNFPIERGVFGNGYCYYNEDPVLNAGFMHFLSDRRMIESAFAFVNSWTLEACFTDESLRSCCYSMITPLLQHYERIYCHPFQSLLPYAVNLDWSHYQEHRNSQSNDIPIIDNDVPSYCYDSQDALTNRILAQTIKGLQNQRPTLRDSMETLRQLELKLFENLHPITHRKYNRHNFKASIQRSLSEFFKWLWDLLNSKQKGKLLKRMKRQRKSHKKKKKLKSPKIREKKGLHSTGKGIQDTSLGRDDGVGNWTAPEYNPLQEITEVKGKSPIKATNKAVGSSGPLIMMNEDDDVDFATRGQNVAMRRKWAKTIFLPVAKVKPAEEACVDSAFPALLLETKELDENEKEHEFGFNDSLTEENSLIFEHIPIQPGRFWGECDGGRMEGGHLLATGNLQSSLDTFGDTTSDTECLTTKDVTEVMLETVDSTIDTTPEQELHALLSTVAQGIGALKVATTGKVEISKFNVTIKKALIKASCGPFVTRVVHTILTTAMNNVTQQVTWMKRMERHEKAKRKLETRKLVLLNSFKGENLPKKVERPSSSSSKDLKRSVSINFQALVTMEPPGSAPIEADSNSAMKGEAYLNAPKSAPLSNTFVSKISHSRPMRMQISLPLTLTLIGGSRNSSESGNRSRSNGENGRDRDRDRSDENQQMDCLGMLGSLSEENSIMSVSTRMSQVEEETQIHLRESPNNTFMMNDETMKYFDNESAGLLCDQIVNGAQIESLDDNNRLRSTPSFSVPSHSTIIASNLAPEILMASSNKETEKASEKALENESKDTLFIVSSSDQKKNEECGCHNDLVDPRDTCDGNKDNDNDNDSCSMQSNQVFFDSTMNQGMQYLPLYSVGGVDEGHCASIITTSSPFLGPSSADLESCIIPPTPRPPMHPKASFHSTDRRLNSSKGRRVVLASESKGNRPPTMSMRPMSSSRATSSVSSSTCIPNTSPYPAISLTGIGQQSRLGLTSAPAPSCTPTPMTTLPPSLCSTHSKESRTDDGLNNHLSHPANTIVSSTSISTSTSLATTPATMSNVSATTAIIASSRNGLWSNVQDSTPHESQERLNNSSLLLAGSSMGPLAISTTTPIPTPLPPSSAPALGGRNHSHRLRDGKSSHLANSMKERIITKNKNAKVSNLEGDTYQEGQKMESLMNRNPEAKEHDLNRVCQVESGDCLDSSHLIPTTTATTTIGTTTIGTTIGTTTGTTAGYHSIANEMEKRTANHLLIARGVDICDNLPHLQSFWLNQHSSTVDNNRSNLSNNHVVSTSLGEKLSWNSSLRLKRPEKEKKDINIVANNVSDLAVANQKITDTVEELISSNVIQESFNEFHQNFHLEKLLERQQLDSKVMNMLR